MEDIGEHWRTLERHWHSNIQTRDTCDLTLATGTHAIVLSVTLPPHSPCRPISTSMIALSALSTWAYRSPHLHVHTAHHRTLVVSVEPLITINTLTVDRSPKVTSCSRAQIGRGKNRQCRCRTENTNPGRSHPPSSRPSKLTILICVVVSVWITFLQTSRLWLVDDWWLGKTLF